MQIEYGVLKRYYSNRELLCVSQDSEVDMQARIDAAGILINIILYRAAFLSSTSDRVGICCTCQKQCNTKRCRCIKNNMKCSTHCHKILNLACGNFAPIATRDEISLVDRTAVAGPVSGMSNFHLAY